MRNENEKERRKKQVPEAFERFAKKSSPKTEVRAMARDEKRRRAVKSARESENENKGDKRTRKPDIRQVEGKQYEKAGGFGQPRPEQDRPRFGRRDDGGRGGDGRGFGRGRGEGRAEGFGRGRGEGRGEQRFGRGEGRGEGFGRGRGEGRGEQRFGRGEGRGEGFGRGRGEGRGEQRFGRGEGRGEGFGRGRGEGRGEQRFGRGESRGEGFGRGRAEGRGEQRFGRGEGRGEGFGRGRGEGRGEQRFGRGRGGDERGGFGRGGGFGGNDRGGFKPKERKFFGPPDNDEADLFEQAWNNRGKPKKESKSPTEVRKRAERSLAGDLAEPMRLNRFIALSGVCSRREADAMIQKGLVTVNGEVAKELGAKVLNGKDVVVVNGKSLTIRQFVYILMNKPKNVITSTEDEIGRKTVMEIVNHYTSVRVYPVGRLDRNTTGLLLFTNDGDMAKKLTHPSHRFEKLYHVRLDKPISEDHLAQLKVGVELEDGLAQVDDIEFVEGAGRDEVGLKIHIGRNRIVRRMFEHLGYEVIMLDRTQYGPLHKQGLKRGTCRPLTEAEIGFLKMVQ